MRFTTQVTALLSALATTSLATNVFSHFCTGGCRSVPKISFDVTNPDCFSVEKGAHKVYFTQAGTAQQADGTMCLYGFNAGGCRSLNESDARQEFQDVKLRGYGIKRLDPSFDNATSFTWSNDTCVPPHEPSE